MSIVRVGLAETKNFAEGYDAIFGKKKDQAEEQTEQARATGEGAEPAKKEEKK